MRTRLGISLLTAAALASLLAHALLFATFSVVRVGGAVAPEVAEMAVVFEDPEAAKFHNPPPEFEIGRPEAEGYGTHEVAGREEQVAREAPQDQPQLSLDPVGRSKVVEVPSAPLEQPGQSAAQPAQSATRLEAPAVPPAPAFVPRAWPLDRASLAELLERLTPLVAEWTPPATLSENNETPSAPAPTPPNVPQVPMPPAEARPQMPSPQATGTGADPAPKSDSEVDAFSVLGSAQFREGRVTVRSGRQVKTRRPKIGLAGLIDLSQRSTAQVLLKVAIDETGKVTNVEVAKSSGSNEIDQPCRVAMYEWWFEPKRGPDGRAVPDVFQFGISFR